MRKSKPANSMQTITTTLWRRLQEGGFILLAALSIFLFVALITYQEADPGWSRTATGALIGNAAGKIGAWFSDLFLTLFGYIAYMFPTMIAYGGFRLFQNRFVVGYFSRLLWILRVLGFLLAVASGCGIVSLHYNPWLLGLPYTAGGVLGQIVIAQLIPAFGQMGATLLLVAIFLAGITLATGLSWFGLMDYLGKISAIGILQIQAYFPSIWNKCMQFFRYLKDKTTFGNPVLIGNQRKTSILSRFTFKSSSTDNKTLLKSRSPVPRLLEQSKQSSGANPPLRGDFPASKNTNSKKVSGNSFLSKAASVSKSISTLSAIESSAHLLNNLPTVELLEVAQSSPSSSDYNASSYHASSSHSNQKLDALSREVETRLLEFGVPATVVGVYPGPVITRFELELAAGIKVSKISGLSKDLARALLVTRVRVVEVIPGKSVVGLEIPNEERELVRLREIIESEQYRESTSPLTLALGKDIAGEPIVVNLTKMPHLLVAGTTGSGKSVGVNVMLLSLLFKATPKEVRLILIDPKMLELSIYDGIPHLLTPVVTDMKDAANVLRWCVGEMERRYQLMAALGVRNLIGYNRKIQDAENSGTPLMNPLWRPEMGGEQPALERFPYIVVIIDEFADMMMVVGKKVEELIARIAQKARAAGIHMILATQRPSVDVITGLIKANVPTRIAYQVSSRIDSRTILDQQGAEQLLGHGDMLYLAPGAGIPTRVHGAFVSDEEVHSVVKAIKQSGEPDYEQDILSGNAGSGSWGLGGSVGGYEEGGDGEQDDLYDQAVQIVIESRRASISHLQRRLKIGYNRSARLIETMEIAGVVGPMQSNGSRDVLAPPLGDV
jgi:S-DNA-T family DNA segregation ATPase FtsK/SpoIIIE